jgi:hypothetical protein
MELKHLVVGVVVFALLGVGLFYLGSLLTGVEGGIRNAEGPPPPIAEIFEAVEDVRSQAEEAQQRQEMLLRGEHEGVLRGAGE